MIEEANAIVAHKLAVMVDFHYASVATTLVAMLTSGRQDLSAGLAVSEPANLRHLSGIFSIHLVSYASFFGLLLFIKQLNIIVVHADHKLGRCLLVRHLNVSHHGSVEALQ